MAHDQQERWVIVNADRPFETVQAEIRSILLDRLGSWGY